ncbi:MULTISPECIES: hypothetical protein [Thermocrispum]|jgi:hypothetical protein|nr:MULTISPECIES: hypothetical protein [Thermocrispum]
MATGNIAKRVGGLAAAGAVAFGGLVAGATPALADGPGPGINRVCLFVDFDVTVKWTFDGLQPRWAHFPASLPFENQCVDVNWVDKPGTITVHQGDENGAEFGRAEDYDPAEGATIVIYGDEDNPQAHIHT